ncbi:transposase [Rhizobium sp. BK181]|nr:transposase [Rhizobium sp. BK181]MCS3744375.1 transposase [Rhizobium sp. BK661]
MNQASTIGLDLAKHVFQVHGADNEGSALFNRKLGRTEVLRFFERLPPCLVGMEACGGAHYWAREIAQLGHDVRLIPPAYVKPFVKRGKTDEADATFLALDAVGAGRSTSSHPVAAGPLLTHDGISRIHDLQCQHLARAQVSLDRDAREAFQC